PTATPTNAPTATPTNAPTPTLPDTATTLPGQSGGQGGQGTVLAMLSMGLLSAAAIVLGSANRSRRRRPARAAAGLERVWSTRKFQ
ncbi:MAG: cell wall anchor protein, partial [Chloroflexota bacterium]